MMLSQFGLSIISLLLIHSDAQLMFHSLPLASSNSMLQQPTLKPSLYPPVLKVKSREGYLYENADIGVSLN